MNIQNVLNEVATALRTIPPLAGRVYAWNVGKVTPPAAIVDLPEKVVYDATYVRGADSLDLTFMVILGALTERTTSSTLSAYLSGSGTNSVKAAVDGFEYTACDDVTVTEAEVMVATIGAVQYLAAQFSATAMGSGA